MKKTTKLKFGRRKKGKTDYAKRLALLKSGKHRAVYRKSNKRITMQLVEFLPGGDKTIASAYSDKLEKFGWTGSKNLGSAYLTGYWLGKKAQKAGVKEAVFDLGMVLPVHGGRAFSALNGLVDSGLKVPSNESVFPKEERLKGKNEKLEEAKKKIETGTKGE